mgnify:FL=1
MEDNVEYVKIEKSFLLDQWHKLNNEISILETKFELDDYKIERVKLLRNSLQDLSFIISKTIPL